MHSPGVQPASPTRPKLGFQTPVPWKKILGRRTVALECGSLAVARGGKKQVLSNGRVCSYSEKDTAISAGDLES